MTTNLKKKIIDILLKEKKKEYLCHIQYVLKIAMKLTKDCKDYDIDPEIIELSCLLHDIGRGKELEGEGHSQTGKRITEEILQNSKFSNEKKQKIYSCILSHNSPSVPKSIEEEIVRSADAGSKVEYHEAFMLMCKKNTYEERLAWGIKYLQKGFDEISIDLYKEKCKPKYNSIIEIYNNIFKEI